LTTLYFGIEIQVQRGWG